MSSPTLMPIKLLEHLQLSQIGINASNVSFARVNMASEKYICVREDLGEESQVVIVDMANKFNPSRKLITADSVIIHPESKIIAVKGKAGVNSETTMAIFNLETNSELKTYTLKEEVIFWKWICLKHIALITKSSVYHWALDPGYTPNKKFDRCSSLDDCEIINYHADPVHNWLLLVGLSAQQSEVTGAMQLYSVEKECSELINGHAACFGISCVMNNSKPSILLCIAERTMQNGKLRIIEVEPCSPGDQPFATKCGDIFFSPEAQGDFPVAMQVSTKYEFLYLITKYGYLHIYDVESGGCIYINRISSETIFVTALHEETEGIIGVNRAGQVLSVSVDEENIIRYVKEVLHAPDWALRLAIINNLPGAEELSVNKFQLLYQNGQYTEAAWIAATSPEGILRTVDTIQMFQKVSTQTDENSPLLQYFRNLVDQGVLDRDESCLIGKYCEPLDDTLTYLIYKQGQCDQEFISFCNFQSRFELEAWYVVYRRDQALWAEVLQESNPYRSQLIDQVIRTSVDETQDEDRISALVKAFMVANLEKELLEILEKLMFGNTLFSDHRNLQNLLLLTAMKVDGTRLMDYINRLDNYDASHIANVAISNNLYQEAFVIYKKYNQNTSAIQVLIEQLKDVDLAYNFAEQCNEPAVWKQLAMAQLDQGLIKDAFHAFVKADDELAYKAIVECASEKDNWEHVVEYLQMARNKDASNRYIESSLMYAYAKIGRLSDLEELILELKAADMRDVQKIGDRLCKMSENPKFAYVAYVGTNERDIVPVENIKNFEYLKHDPKKKYKVKWQNQLYYGTIAFFGDSEENIKEQAEKNRPKFIPENLLFSNDESDECTSTDSLVTLEIPPLLTTKLALLLEKQTKEKSQEELNKSKDTSSQCQKERTEGKSQEEINKSKDTTSQCQKERNDNGERNIPNGKKMDKRAEKINMLEQKLSEIKIENRRLRVEIDTLKTKNKELHESSNEFQRLNITLQRDAIQGIQEMKIQLSTLVNKPFMPPQPDQLEFPEVGFIRGLDNSIHIGRGVWLKNEIYDTIACTSKTPSTFATNMAVAVFGTTCLKTSTVTGKISNRIKNKSNKIARPALDATKLLAIEDIFRFWLQKDKKANSVQINCHIYKMTSYLSKKISQLNYVKKHDEIRDIQILENSGSSISDLEDKLVSTSADQKVQASPSSDND